MMTKEKLIPIRRYGDYEENITIHYEDELKMIAAYDHDYEYVHDQIWLDAHTGIHFGHDLYVEFKSLEHKVLSVNPDVIRCFAAGVSPCESRFNDQASNWYNGKYKLIPDITTLKPDSSETNGHCDFFYQETPTSFINVTINNDILFIARYVAINYIDGLNHEDIMYVKDAKYLNKGELKVNLRTDLSYEEFIKSFDPIVVPVTMHLFTSFMNIFEEMYGLDESLWWMTDIVGSFVFEDNVLKSTIRSKKKMVILSSDFPYKRVYINGKKYHLFFRAATNDSPKYELYVKNFDGKEDKLSLKKNELPDLTVTDIFKLLLERYARRNL